MHKQTTVLSIYYITFLWNATLCCVSICAVPTPNFWTKSYEKHNSDINITHFTFNSLVTSNSSMSQCINFNKFWSNLSILSNSKTIYWNYLQIRNKNITERQCCCWHIIPHILWKSTCLHYLLLEKRDPDIIDILCHANTFKPLLIKTDNVAIHSYRNAWIIIVINTASLNYVLYINRWHRH